MDKSNVAGFLAHLVENIYVDLASTVHQILRYILHHCSVKSEHNDFTCIGKSLVTFSNIDMK